MLPGLLPLLTGPLAKILPFGKILSGILGGNKAAIREALLEKLDVQEGRTGGKMLARGVCEAIDKAMENSTLDAEDSVKLGTALARNAALQAAEYAESLLAYAPLQAAVVAAKRSGDQAQLAAARKVRDGGLERCKQAAIDIQRVASGNDPREVKP